MPPQCDGHCPFSFKKRWSVWTLYAVLFARFSLSAGGKPSTWFPPGGLVEQDNAPYGIDGAIDELGFFSSPSFRLFPLFFSSFFHSFSFFCFDFLKTFCDFFLFLFSFSFSFLSVPFLFLSFPFLSF